MHDRWPSPLRAAASLAAALALVFPAATAYSADAGDQPGNPYNDPPPLQATHGIARCVAPKARALTPQEARLEAHQRIERGTSCWLAGQCEPGGDYRHDAEISARVAESIAHDTRFANSSLWVETLRRFVTIKGCLADAGQGRTLEAKVKAIDGVKLVWQEAVVTPEGARGAGPSHIPTRDTRTTE